MALGFLSLFAGVAAGLARLGWTMPDIAANASAQHAVLMIGGFFGTLIGIERAVALARPWAYLGPLCTGLGGLAVLAGAGVAATIGAGGISGAGTLADGGAYAGVFTSAAASGWTMAPAPWLILAGSLVFLAASLAVCRKQPATFTATLALGALAWVAGNALWLAGRPLPVTVPWWLCFLILTIAGERLELSRFLPKTVAAQRAFVAILVVLGIALVAIAEPWGVRLFAGGLLALALWLAKQDLARRTVRGRGLTRYIAVCLLSGYGWLAAGALVMLGAGALAPGTRAWDAALHALALGFVFSMVFGHAPIIFPAVLRVAVPYTPAFYAPLALLHGSLALRLLGDAATDPDWLRIGGLLNALALAAFVLGMIITVARGRRGARPA
jgi:hypothetical protein